MNDSQPSASPTPREHDSTEEEAAEAGEALVPLEPRVGGSPQPRAEQPSPRSTPIADEAARSEEEPVVVEAGSEPLGPALGDESEAARAGGSEPDVDDEAPGDGKQLLEGVSDDADVDAVLDLDGLPDFEGPEDSERPGAAIFQQLRDKLAKHRIVFLSCYDERILRGTVGYLATTMRERGGGSRAATIRFMDATRNPEALTEEQRHENETNSARTAERMGVQVDRWTVQTILEKGRMGGANETVVVLSAMTRDAMRAHRLESREALAEAEQNLDVHGVRILVLSCDAALPSWTEPGMFWEHRDYVQGTGDHEQSGDKGTFHDLFIEVVGAYCGGNKDTFLTLLRGVLEPHEMRKISSGPESFDNAASKSLQVLVNYDRVDPVLAKIDGNDGNSKLEECWELYRRLYRGVGSHAARSTSESSMLPLIDRVVRFDSARAIATSYLTYHLLRKFLRQVEQRKWGSSRSEISDAVRAACHELGQAVKLRAEERKSEEIRDGFFELDPLAKRVRIVAANFHGSTIDEFDEIMRVIVSQDSWYRHGETGELVTDPSCLGEHAVEVDGAELWDLHGDDAFRRCDLRVSSERRSGVSMRVVSESVEEQSLGWRERLEHLSPLLVRQCIAALCRVDYLLFRASPGVFDRILELLAEGARLDAMPSIQLLRHVKLQIGAEAERWPLPLLPTWQRGCSRIARILAMLMPALDARREVEVLLKEAVNRQSALRVLRITFDLSSIGLFDPDLGVSGREEEQWAPRAEFRILRHIHSNGGKQIGLPIRDVVSWRCRRLPGAEVGWWGVDAWMKDVSARAERDESTVLLLSAICADVLGRSFFVRSDDDARDGGRVQLQPWMQGVLSSLLHESKEAPTKGLVAPVRWLLVDELFDDIDDEYFESWARRPIQALAPGLEPEDYAAQVLEEAKARKGSAIGRELFIASILSIWDMTHMRPEGDATTVLDSVLAMVDGEDPRWQGLKARLGRIDDALRCLEFGARSAEEGPRAKLVTAVERLRRSLPGAQTNQE